ncbi:MAG: arginase family protein [Lysobacter sp.]
MDASLPAIDPDTDAVGDDAERWVLARSMCVEQIDEAAATIYLQSNGARVRIPRALYQLLLQFEQPRSLLSVAGSVERSAKLAGPVGSLRAKGFLIAEGEAEAAVPRRSIMDSPVRLFDCPAQKLAPARADVVVLGMPYDFGDRDAAGARSAPQAIREVSLQTLYAIDRRSGRPQGWFDADRGCAILQGVSIGDAGDVFVDYGETQAAAFGRLGEVLQQLIADGAMPMLLGGDASVSWPAIQALQARQARQPLAVIRIGGAARASAGSTPAFVSAACLPDRALQLAGVAGYVQVAARAAVNGADDSALPRFRSLSVADIRRDGYAALASQLDPGQAIYLGIDLGAVATAGTPADEAGDRFDYPELHALLCALGAAHPIVGLDLVGAVPSRPGWNVAAMTALHLLLTALSAAKDRHES